MVIDLQEYRRSRRIVPPIHVVLDEDVRIAFARRVEQRAWDREVAEMRAWLNATEGKLPARNCEDVRPSDTDGDDAA